jgi:rieske iron-sulfur protein
VFKNETVHKADACAPCGGGCGAALAGRRTVLKTMTGMALVGAGIGPAMAADERPRAGDWLVRIDDESMTALRSADIKTGEKQIIALPYDPVTETLRDGSRLNRIVLIKLDTGAMDEVTQPLAADGVIAYSAFCTHQGCDVSSWLPEEQALLCFCHFSKFSPLQNGAVLDGPAPRALPALALKVDGGRLVVAAGFSSEPGKSA